MIQSLEQTRGIKILLHFYINLEIAVMSFRIFFLQNFPKFNKRRAVDKALGPGKSQKLINVGRTFIPDYREKGI